jgi:hypothetical protein
MSSTYSTSLRIQLIDTGTENEAWGQPLDNNLGTIIEQAIVGSNTISLTNLTTYSLTTANAAVDQARNAVLVFNGALTANCNVVAPSVKKVYVVSNKTTGGKFVNIKTSSGNAVSVINGTNQLVYCDGTDFKSAVNVNTVIGNLSVSGNATIAGNVSIGGNITASNVIASSNGNITLTSNTSIVQLGNNTGAYVLPTGNTAQRPSTVKLGMQRWNTDLNWMELWNGIVWYPLTGSYGVTYVVVAGGGGGGNGSGAGGGGAGGALLGGITVQSGTAYSVTIGAGGSTNTQGSNTIALGFTAVGGGAGATSVNAGGSGGSGGGAATDNGSGATRSGGARVVGQGNTGGDSGNGSDNLNAGGGGGGAGVAGGYGVGGNPATGGAGGNGVSSSISGTLVYYAGGGGGAGSSGATNSPRGPAGLGGGGIGGLGNSGGAGFGTANTGGGGGGFAAAGGSGITILSYASPTQTATGGTVTSYSSGGTTYWVHTFTTSGTFTA